MKPVQWQNKNNDEATKKSVAFFVSLYVCVVELDLEKIHWGKTSVYNQMRQWNSETERLEKRERMRRTHREKQRQRQWKKKSQRIVKDETPVT